MLCSLGHDGAVRVIKRFADFATDKGTGKRTKRNANKLATAFAELCACNGATNSTKECAGGLLLALILGAAGDKGGHNDRNNDLTEFHVKFAHLVFTAPTDMLCLYTLI